MPSSNYSSSTHSASSSHNQHSSVKLSLRQRIKRVMADLGHPPTYRYDQEHPQVEHPTYVLMTPQPFAHPRVSRI